MTADAERSKIDEIEEIDEIDDDFEGLAEEEDEEATRDVSLHDDEYADFIESSIVATLRDLLTVKYAPQDGATAATSEPVAYTVAGIKDELESFRELLEVVNEDGGVESVGEGVARIADGIAVTNARLDTVGRLLFKINKTLAAVADKLGAQATEKQTGAAAAAAGGGDK